jgi:hypothetical protein
MDDLLDPDLLPWLIQLGLADLDGIRAAADAAIAETEAPSELLIDLSMSKSLYEVMGRVRPDLTTRPSDNALARTLARFRLAIESDAMELGTAIHRYHSFAMTTLEPWSDVWQSAVRLEDDYELAVQRVAGTIPRVRRSLIEDLERLEEGLGG